jgi:predicted MPP superfamily phosphohydrolase
MTQPALRPGLLRFFLIVTSIIGLLHLYIGARILDAFLLSPFTKTIIILLVLLAFAALTMGFLARFIISESKYADLFSWIGMLSMGLFSSVLVLTFLRDLVLVVCSLFFDYTFMAKLHIFSEIFVLVGAALASVIGLIAVIRVPDIIEVKIPIKNLSPNLRDFTIVQLSDIHIGSTIKGNYLARIVEQVNQLNPSIVAITGDLVDGTVEKLHAEVAPLKNLQSDYGTYFVTGNHEYYSGVSDWIVYLRSLEIHVLINEHQVIQHLNSKIVVAGICDYSADQFIAQHTPDPELALTGTESLDALKIMLAHQPRSAAEIAKTGAQVQLSGHTHGGQFWPWNFFVKLQQPYNVGLHKLNNLWIYINRGTGYWGPPKRLGKRSEITVIRFINE